MLAKTITTLNAVYAIIFLVAIGAFLYQKSHTAQPTASPSASVAASASPEASPSVSGQSVTVLDFAFSPKDITVNAGDTVTWTNQDSMDHTVTSTDGGPLDSGNLSKGASYRHTFSTPGTYRYHCAYHPSMTGTVTVR